MKNTLQVVFAMLLSGVVNLTQGQEFRIPLYNGPVPDARDTVIVETSEFQYNMTMIRKVQTPDIAVYLPSKRSATGQAVVVCPGGGYWVLAYDWEGSDVARYLNSIGVAAIVVKYRLPVYGNTLVPHKAPLMDAQRAMRLTRFNATKWNIDPGKIGVMGFSAGGHLASTLGTHFDYGHLESVDSVEGMSCRPDFMILMYPVITFTDPSVHVGSRDALLGAGADKNMLMYYSNELQVKDDTPPAFLVHADNDKTVPAENSLLMYKALRAKNISAELHIISEGEHGFSLGIGNDHLHSWTRNLELWLGWLNNQKPATGK